MSLFGSLLGDVEDDPFFGSHLRHMRQMNNMMNSLFSDPFGMMDGRSPLAIEGPRHGGALMPFMPQMPSLNKMFSMNHGIPGFDGNMSAGSSFSSSTVVMSSGPGGKPQVFSTSSSTRIGPNGIKETRKSLQDTRTGTKKMSIGHHIGERAHVIAREHNVYSGDSEETQEYINIEEDEAEEFNREFETHAGRSAPPGRAALLAPPRRGAPLPAPLAITAPPAHSSEPSRRSSYRETLHSRPSSRRPIRTTASPLTTSASPSVREVYSAPHPQRRHKSSRPSHTHTSHTQSRQSDQ